MVQAKQGADVRNMAGGLGITDIYVDTREKPHAIVKILAEFDRRGITVHRQALGEGDYKLSPDARVTIDRKQNLEEVCSNLTWQRDRFQRELRRCHEQGETIYILVEHGGLIRTLADVAEWRNPRLKHSPKAVDGPQLYKLMLTYAAMYGVRWRFCDKRHTGKEIIRLLMEADTDAWKRDREDC